ncbi:lipopolysaccharide heptosyltransferase II [candidate division KSB3 bacterium]|uniref:lipopolysaccharide heptosyltransferase II n=1 Tax=candidate division KSB3 bacterium TaxID=2044937 RepID=A0A2G6KJB2_9BACT|nr:MAG: lipopolysaccharide heptosyltransferase II [candidate division KSB3 bacterium]
MKNFDIHHILIIRFSSIGDIVLTTPVVRAVRRAFPQARVDFLTKQAFTELLETSPHLDRVHAYDRRYHAQRLRQLGTSLRKNRYDLCIDLHNNLRSHLFRFLIRPRKTVTYSKQILRRTLLVKAGLNYYADIIQVPDRYLRPLAQFNIVGDSHGLELFPTEAHYTHVQAIFQQEHLDEEEPAIGLGPVASFPLKQWPIEKFVALGKLLAHQHQARIIIFGGPHDRDIGETIAKQLPNAPIVLCGHVSLLESAAALTRCAVFIGNDTGTVHIATAMQTPVVVVFGPTSEELGFYPYHAPQSQVICASLPCRPCTHTGKGKCKISDVHACMQRISVEEAQEAVSNMLPAEQSKKYVDSAAT